MKTVKEISQLSGVSVRTLHYYDRINLLTPSLVAVNGYRYYDDQALKRLQAILLFRELDFPLKDIKRLLEDSAYDQKLALEQQIAMLEAKKVRLQRVIDHAKSLQEEKGDIMNFTAYDKSQLQAFQAEAKERWGDKEAYQEFAQKTSDQDFAQISQEMIAIMATFGRLKDLAADDQVVQNQVKVLQNYISQNFYDCSPEILAQLGQIYVTDHRFKEAINQAGGQGTADFINAAITYYCR